MLEKCIELICAQQGGMDEMDIVYQVGEHLKDIVRTTPGAAELVAVDIVQDGMGITNAEKKIKEYADAHKKSAKAAGSSVPFYKADEILREFYGLPKRGEQVAAAEAPRAEPAKAVNILDFL